MENNLQFTEPTLWQRLKSMLSVDFYRLTHTPMFYIFLAIAAIIPAMIVSMTGSESDMMYDTIWQIIAAHEPLYIVKSIGDYANMNMVFIFGGIMISIFIGHDYRSGYVKQLFTTHAKKQDYIISKSLIGAFAMACMCLTYLLGGIAGGLFAGLPWTVNFGSLLIAVISKMMMSIGWASLYAFLNIILRRYFGVSIAASFMLGTGILIIGAAGVLGNSAILNIFLYGSSVYACLSANIITLLICSLCSIAWAVIYNIVGTLILNKSDVY